MELKARLFLLWPILWRRPAAVILGGWGLLGIYDQITSQIVPSPSPKVYDLLPRIGWPWYIWVIIGLVLLMVLILEGSYQEIRKRDDLLQNELAILELVFGDHASCVQISPYLDIHEEEIGQHRLFRVGIKNLGKVTVDDVRVSLTVLKPQGNPFLPIEMRRMHSRGNAQTGISVHPGTGPSVFIDVAEQEIFYEDDQPASPIKLCYVLTDVPNVLDPGTHKITLVAQGRNIPPSQPLGLVLSTDADGVLHCRLATNNDQ